VFAPRETRPTDSRCSLSPEAVRRLRALDPSGGVTVESGLGAAHGWSDQAYAEEGARVLSLEGGSYPEADVVVRLHAPGREELERYPAGALSLSFLDPFRQPERLADFAACRVNAASLEMIPRTSVAQGMDALSSQSSLSGYGAVIEAAHRLGRVFPMMVTAAGTLSPARVFVIGVGVAGLQAIATAKRLGARVEAFDTRPEVEEQVRSLGAQFLKIDLGETGQTEGGYAKELTPEQLDRQKEAMAQSCAKADIVITTARVFGRPSPQLVSAAVLERMSAGSVVVDLAADAGGNVEGVVPGEVIRTEGGVTLVGTQELVAMVARDASTMIANNFVAFLEYFYDAEEGSFVYREDDPILSACLLVREGAIVHPSLKPD